jgi:lysophospholipase L1-like esterase
VSSRLVAFFIAILATACGGAAGEPSVLRDVRCEREGEGLPSSTWEASIEAYEGSDVRSPPAPGSVVFVGSSSILLWDTLTADMAPMPVLNRGFGGSVIANVTHFADRIVLPYEPSAIVLYAGDNDIAFGLSADCTFEDFEAFVEHIHAVAPGTPIYFISIKPSPSRVQLWSEMERANGLVEARTMTDPTLHFIDVSEAMLDQQRQPIPELFGEDGLHMNAAGYQLWTSIVRPRLVADLGLQVASPGTRCGSPRL